jgi:hypothetical protein
MLDQPAVFGALHSTRTRQTRQISLLGRPAQEPACIGPRDDDGPHYTFGSKHTELLFLIQMLAMFISI